VTFSELPDILLRGGEKVQALLSACLVVLLLGCATTRESTSPYTLSDVEIGAVIKGIRSARKDLDSPNFRHFSAARSADGRIYVCGWMNSKNSRGFYTADQPFVGQLFAGQFVVDQFGQDQLAMANVLDECRERGVGI
jgi:hypothetical protein